jgi:hypothetical protein
LKNQRKCEQSCSEFRVLHCHRCNSQRLAQSADIPAKVKSNGTVSSSPPPAPRLPTGISWNVAGDLSAADSGSSITEDVSILRADHSTSQASLLGMREVAQPCVRSEGPRKSRIDTGDCSHQKPMHPIEDASPHSRGERCIPVVGCPMRGVCLAVCLAMLRPSRKAVGTTMPYWHLCTQRRSSDGLGFTFNMK